MAEKDANVPTVEIVLDRMERRLGKLERNQDKTHNYLEEFKDHYENTRKVGFMERLSSLDPKIVLLLIALVGGGSSIGTSAIDNIVDRSNSAQHSPFPQPSTGGTPNP